MMTTNAREQRDAEGEGERGLTVVVIAVSAYILIRME